VTCAETKDWKKGLKTHRNTESGVKTDLKRAVARILLEGKKAIPCRKKLDAQTSRTAERAAGRAAGRSDDETGPFNFGVLLIKKGVAPTRT